MGCKSCKPNDATAASSMNDVRAVRRQETFRLVEVLRSLGGPSGPPYRPMLEDSSLHSVSLAVVNGTPELKEAVSKNPDLLSLINNHLGDVIIATLRSLSSVRGLLDKAGDTLVAVCAAAESLDQGNAKGNDTKKKKKKKKKKKNWTKMYSEAVGKLTQSRAMGDPFAGLVPDELLSACQRQRSLQGELDRRKDELKKRLRSTKKWRKALKVVYTAGILAVLACSVVLSAVMPLAAAVAAATALATAMKSVEPWINSLWDKREGSLEVEKDALKAMRKGGLAVHVLEGIMSSVQKLKIDFDAMMEGVDFAIKGEGEEEEMMVKVGIESVMAKKGEVEKDIESLKKQVDSCYAEIRTDAAKLLEMIMEDM